LGFLFLPLAGYVGTQFLPNAWEGKNELSLKEFEFEDKHEF
jgi:hypothetical protein